MSPSSFSLCSPEVLSVCPPVFFQNMVPLYPTKYYHQSVMIHKQTCLF